MNIVDFVRNAAQKYRDKEAAAEAAWQRAKVNLVACLQAMNEAAAPAQFVICRTDGVEGGPVRQCAMYLNVIGGRSNRTIATLVWSQRGWATTTCLEGRSKDYTDFSDLLMTLDLGESLAYAQDAAVRATT